jgi:hypothetical protein
MLWGGFVYRKDQNPLVEVTVNNSKEEKFSDFCHCKGENEIENHTHFPMI